MLLAAGASVFLIGTALWFGIRTPVESVESGVLSENGMYRASYTSEVVPLPVNQIHIWTLHVETADGEPVENATITVDGGMPAHGHGLPTVPQITDYLGDGNYRVEGMKFNMPGAWVITFTIEMDGQEDTVTFDADLQ
jgi:hypothetical protein